MESVDEFALGIVTSEPVQMFCKSQTEGASKEYNTAMLSLSLERQVQRSHNDYRFNANFLNLYAKNGMSEIQFENLPYSDYESCIRYYEDMEIISNDRYTPMTWVDCVKLKDASGKSVNSLIWIRFLYDSVTMEKIGIVVGGINESVFKDIFSVLPHAYLCQADGKVLSAADNHMYGEVLPENVRSQILQSNVAVDSVKTDTMEGSVCFWKDAYFSMMLIVPETTLQAEMQNMTHWYILCSIVIIGVGVLLGTMVNYFLTKSLSKSILSLKDTVQRVDQGELNARFDNATHNDEITYLGEHFNHMLDSLERIYAEQEQEALGRKDLEIQLLQSQINPHLLYNTLNSVALAVRNDEQQTAQDLLYTLSDFIRLSLSNGHSVVTLAEAFVGLMIGIVTGFVMAVLMDQFDGLYKALYPLLILTQTIPTVAIAPLLVLWFGYEMAPKVILIVITTFFPIAVGLLNGFKSADKDSMNMLRAMGAGRWQIFRYIKFPGAISEFFAGIRIAVSYAVVGAVISEWLGGFKGLGVYMTRVKQAFSFDKMFAVIFLISIISLLLMNGVDFLQKNCMPWEKEN